MYWGSNPNSQCLGLLSNYIIRQSPRVQDPRLISDALSIPSIHSAYWHNACCIFRILSDNTEKVFLKNFWFSQRNGLSLRRRLAWQYFRCRHYTVTYYIALHRNFLITNKNNIVVGNSSTSTRLVVFSYGDHKLLVLLQGFAPRSPISVWRCW